MTRRGASTSKSEGLRRRRKAAAGVGWRGEGGAVRGGGEERCWFDGLEGGVLGYLYWGGEGFAWGRGQEID